MSDFVSGFWSVWISAIVLVGIIGLAILLKTQSKSTVKPGEQVETMGHVWDGDLEEYNNPLPRWWMWMFWLTIFFALGYLVVFPGLGTHKGVFGWTSQNQYEGEMKQADAKYKPVFDKFLKMDVQQVAANPEAREIGKRLFMTYCMQCHGADARGAKGFPNLTDNDWLYGGSAEQVHQTIAGGRQGAMPAFGAQFGEDGVKDLANYVRKISNQSHNADAAQRGEANFKTVCAACHGPDAKGNQGIGAPNLTDNIWLYGGSEKTIIETITNGRNNKMPAWKEFLGDAKVHLLTGYVLSLSANKK